MFMNRIRGISLDRSTLVSRAGWFGIATLVLTTVHHAYGAFAFGTPWRLHAALVSVPVAAAIAVAEARYRRHPRGRLGTFAFWTVVGLTGVVAVLVFGVFEGAYNHVLKDVFYVWGAPPHVLDALFPQPPYEPPTDVFFEVSGVMHVVPASLAGLSLWRLVRDERVIERNTAPA